ncbi:hypothetical protein GCM10008955_10500 [Deinococcus malanensis]|uniref:Proteinase inhibitor I42 chagasin domain-containing protein n=1 Tax=Deinococcus malanensis TaxID=1706855 RepID=A0ABQ2ESQ7_9DEIO|nr:hypothetical protein GCM10008955_10500 [Deinococcus malanensis]
MASQQQRPEAGLQPAAQPSSPGADPGTGPPESDSAILESCLCGDHGELMITDFLPSQATGYRWCVEPGTLPLTAMVRDWKSTEDYYALMVDGKNNPDAVLNDPESKMPPRVSRTEWALLGRDCA